MSPSFRLGPIFSLSSSEETVTFLFKAMLLGSGRGKTGLTKDQHLTEFDADHYLVKEEVTHYGTKKVILKNKRTGKILQRETTA